MIISYIDSITSSNINYKNFDLKLLKTSKDKKNAPAWNFTQMLTRRSKPSQINGFIIDFDTLRKPLLTDKYTYYIHRTHSKKWRIIVPFEKSHRFTDATDYKREHMRMMQLLFEEDKSVEELLINPHDLNEPHIDPKSLTPTQFYFCCPENEKIESNTGEFFVPKFIKLKRREVQHIFSTPFKINDIAKCQAVLTRMKEFYEYYRTIINFKFIKHKHSRCIVCEDLDANPNNGECQMNNGSLDYVATIFCHHANCKTRLFDKMQMYMPVNEKTQQVQMIRNYTVLYLAYGIIKGKYALDQVEACGYHEHKQMLLNHKDLLYLCFIAKKDCPTWIKILYENIVLRPQDNQMFIYKNGVYECISKPILKAHLHDSAGTYAKYRAPKLDSKDYVAKLVEFGAGRMLQNYNRLRIPDGINLQNGSFNFHQDGYYEFNAPTPSLFYTHKLPFSYDPDAKCPTWIKTLIDYFDDENAPQALILQEFFGYCLTYDRRFEKLLVLFGVTGGGKNTLMTVLRSLIPTEISTMKMLCSVKDNEFIVDKKLIIVNESLGKFQDSTVNTLKKLASSDPEQIRPLYGPAFTLDQVPKIALTFNEAPATMKIDEALKARMLTIKLVKRFRNTKNSDVHLADRLSKELPGILNWALRGYSRLYKKGSFTNYVRDTNELYANANEELQDLACFLKLSREESLQWSPMALYDRYILKSGETFMTLVKFAKETSRLGAHRYRDKTGKRIVDLTNIIANIS